MKKTLSIILLSSLSVTGFTQENNWMSFNSTEPDTVIQKVELDYSVNDGTVTILQDARIEKIEQFVRSGEEGLDGVLIDGYRVLIYFDQDKSKSEQQKANFMALYREHKAYVDYMAPNYRVRVGNFRSKLEAEKLKQELIGIFPTAIVVADKIQLPVLDPPINN